MSSEVSAAILEHLRTGRWSSASALYVTLGARGFARATIGTHLARLEERGSIERRGHQAVREIRVRPAAQAGV